MGAAERANLANRQAAAKHMLEQLRQAIPPEGHQLIDAYGRPIRLAGTYGFTSTFPLPVNVVSVDPDRRPQAPPGAYVITVTAQIPIQAMSRVPIRSLLEIVAGPTIEQLEAEIKAIAGGDVPGELATTGLAQVPTGPTLVQLTDQD